MTYTNAITVNQGDNPPVAEAGGPYSGSVGTPLLLDGSASTDLDIGLGDSIVLYEWDVDNNGIFDTSSISPTLAYTYTTPYSGLVNLRVTDSLGLSGQDTAAVTVTDTTPPSNHDVYLPIIMKNQ